MYPPNSSSPPSPERLTVTSVRASRATRYVGSADASANGSSNSPTTLSTKRSAAGTTSRSVWRVPSAAATRRACGASLYACSANPIAKVWGGRDRSPAMSATTVDESSPPDKKAPSGTSDSRWLVTACPSNSRRCSVASSSLSGARSALTGVQ